MKSFKILSVLLVTVTLMAGALPAQQKTFKVVVNKSNPVSSLTQKQVSNFFLKKVTKWSNGENVQPLDLIETSAVREKFSKDIHSRKVSSIKAYWQKQIFSGRKIPPPEKKSAREVLSFVSNNPGAIGYISATINETTRNVKVVKIVK